MPDLCHFENDQWVMLIAATGVIMCKDFCRLRLLKKKKTYVLAKPKQDDISAYQAFGYQETRTFWDKPDRPISQRRACFCHLADSPDETSL